MEVKKTSRAIIIINDKLLVIKRTKYLSNGDRIFYTFPGGHLEENETFEDTVVREVFEEIGIEVRIENLFEEYLNEEVNKLERFYICSYVSGKIGTGTGEEFTNINLEKYGKYEIEFIDIKDIKKYNLLPEYIKTMLVEKFS